MNVAQLLAEAGRRIARRDAEVLLLHVAGRDRAWLLAHPEATLPEAQVRLFEALVSRRERQEPLQYITGRQEFFGMELRVTPAVLIPRPETELLVEAALRWAQAQASDDRPVRRIVDVGTGSGAIALALCRALPDTDVWATDLSDAALAVARNNAARLCPQARLHFVQGDLLAGVADHLAGGSGLDFVVSNPPYIPVGDAPALQPEVRDFEPHTALFAGEDGLPVYRRLIPQARATLRPGGLLALEFGFGQQPALAALLQGWDRVRFLEDYAGIPRIALAERSFLRGE